MLNGRGPGARLGQRFRARRGPGRGTWPARPSGRRLAAGARPSARQKGLRPQESMPQVQFRHVKRRPPQPQAAVYGVVCTLCRVWRLSLARKRRLVQMFQNSRLACRQLEESSARAGPRGRSAPWRLARHPLTAAHLQYADGKHARNVRNRHALQTLRADGRRPGPDTRATGAYGTAENRDRRRSTEGIARAACCRSSSASFQGPSAGGRCRENQRSALAGRASQLVHSGR